jgi:hypothetical protein
VYEAVGTDGFDGPARLATDESTAADRALDLMWIVVSSRRAVALETGILPYHPGDASKGNVRWSFLRMVAGGISDSSVDDLGRSDIKTESESFMACAGDNDRQLRCYS